ncbi:MAG: triose-phosphate isomerase [Alphaproteobacteria bacterium CG11_big_fil_rev_8_21_14_0_20_44_7]|nr:MAG: triose-phosphate isomerase [Alphaproteobacteria bacterium CG11_big_fil_rev_8_21_14_0_20_44_7]
MLDKFIIAANWKMNGTPAEARSFAAELDEFIREVQPQSEIVVCPPYILLNEMHGSFKKGGQNCHHETSGAFTGEISAKMLKNAACEYVILGHSERREMGESSELIAKKAQAAKAAGVKVIFCIGEKEGEDFESVISEQLNFAVDVDVIAYEPVWAIGTGKTPSLEEINSRHKFIKDKCGLQVMYGGSANPDNAKDISALQNVGGLLVGGASLSISSFTSIIEAK